MWSGLLVWWFVRWSGSGFGLWENRQEKGSLFPDLVSTVVRENVRDVGSLRSE
ncbi:hypothetical protein GMO_08210 [Gluconobacter morbifer G707]|uniref:Uncharacterized protein n=1 Tax=Gluconobacter morbifer G707 TaxID=1088869 RepID=G6XH56_9PROT|nr:hypothetical protein GMO_08210 [Gluconobacter morbifer G707]